MNPQNMLEGSLQAGSLLAYPLAFAGGLLSSLSPCTYPLIPVTIAYIGSRDVTNRRHGFTLSFAYVVGIACTYAVLGGISALSGNLFGTVATHPMTPLGVGLFLILMALGELEVIKLSLPHFFIRAVQLQSGCLVSTLAGGMVMGLVISPCILPVFGTLLMYVASRKNVLFGTTLMFTFAMGMGALLIAVGTFSSLFSRLPHSGPWLVIVKQAMGILLLTCGVYFLVQAAKLY